jgi:HAD superfamily hydrolase (TIGR01509 family)
VLRWVFLDVGNVLMNDDPAMALLYRELHRGLCSQGYRISFRDLLAEREELIRTRGPEHWAVLGRKYLGEEGQYRLMHRCASRMRADYMASHALIPGMDAAVRRLADRFALGVVANQLKEVSNALDQIGLGRYIRVRAISEAVGIRKPDPALYLWALDRAGCEPREAVMIGDRSDNDIAPARAVGMWTILLRIPHEQKAYRPREEYEALYFESQSRASIGRIPPAGSGETPDLVAESVEGMLSAVDEIARRAMTSSEGLSSRR